MVLCGVSWVCFIDRMCVASLKRQCYASIYVTFITVWITLGCVCIYSYVFGYGLIKGIEENIPQNESRKT